ncbi:MAG: hypothetical protein LBU87_00215, partial [Lactobacillales bacterium]|nr:hypothetical protein [Lactobacillales bacterium]
GGSDGLNAYRALAEQMKKILNPLGLFLCEIGQGQETDVITLMESAGLSFVKSYKDMPGIIRVLSFKNL